jgi:SAM-dependent methyltransferase
MDTTGVEQDPVQWWEAFYREGRGRWSGKPNRSLVDEVAGLRPGRALDLGCGQGADAIWLALQGWQVTGVDVSSIALETAAHAAAAAGVPDGAIRWEQRDLAVSPVAGEFELVCATFLHSPVEFPRARVLREAAELIVPGGTLLVIGHVRSESHPELDLPDPDEVAAELALPADRWALRVSERREVQHAFKGEAPRTRVDGVLRWERLGE